LSNTIKNLSPGGKTPAVSWLGNIKIVSHKEYGLKEPMLTEDERMRLIVWNNAKVEFVFNAVGILIFLAVLPFLYKHSTNQVEKYIFPQLAGNASLSLSNKVLIVIILAAVYILCAIVNMFVHEVLHIAALPKRIRNQKIYIAFRVPLYIGMWHYERIKKSEQITVLLCPVVIIGVFSLCCAFVVKNPIAEYAFLLWAWLNFGNSISDIVNAIYLAVKMPKNALISDHFIIPQDKKCR
jgi:NADH:ubiquinone oxidoreductase subunit 5 (subunit L)/multisubunit Na+/H+ antiporter MnhA subunit